MSEFNRNHSQECDAIVTNAEDSPPKLACSESDQSTSGDDQNSVGDDQNIPQQTKCLIPDCNVNLKCNSVPITFSHELNRLVETNSNMQINDNCQFINHIFHHHSLELSTKVLTPERGKLEKHWKCPVCDYSTTRKCNLHAHLLKGKQKQIVHHPQKHFYCWDCHRDGKLVELYNVQSAACHWQDIHGVSLVKKTRGRAKDYVKHPIAKKEQSVQSANITSKDEKQVVDVLLRMASTSSMTSSVQVAE
jgi:hypothetical protein